MEFNLRNRNNESKVFVAGHNGLIGSSLIRKLSDKPGYRVIIASRTELNLLDTGAVNSFLGDHKPDVVIVAAAKVGGIGANMASPSEFLYENLQIQNNLIWGSHHIGVPRLVFLGSSCIYPRMAPQPMTEQALLTGPLEITNRPYALAKIAGLELVSSIRRQYGRHYFSVMPTNLYGPRDNFRPGESHVLPALLRRFFEAKESRMPEVVVWGSGSPRREFLYVDDCAEGIIHLINCFDESKLADRAMADQHWCHVNLGSGAEVTIRELAHIISDAVGFTGVIRFDPTKPDGTPRKLMDSSLAGSMGWSASTSLKQGISLTLRWFESEYRKGPGSGLRI